MKNRTRIIAIITILLCALVYPAMKGSQGGINARELQRQEMDMGRLFQGTGCTWLKTHVNSWALVGKLPLSIEELEDMGLGIVRHLELEDDSELSKNHNNDLKQISIKALDKKKTNYDIIISNTRNNDDIGVGDTYDTHIIVNALMDYDLIEDKSVVDKPMNPQELSNKIESYFQSIGKDPQTSITYTGAFKGELTKKQKKLVLSKLIKEVKGKATQVMEDDDIMSVAGYSSVIHTAPIENINFHLALRYSDYSNLTYLWMGSPIITIEY